MLLKKISAPSPSTPPLSRWVQHRIVTSWHTLRLRVCEPRVAQKAGIPGDGTRGSRPERFDQCFGLIQTGLAALLPPPLAGIFSIPRVLSLARQHLRIPESQFHPLQDLCPPCTFHLLLPFHLLFLTTPSSRRTRNSLCPSDPASLAASVTLALASPPYSCSGALWPTTTYLTFALPRHLGPHPYPHSLARCRPRPRASKPIWIGTLSSMWPPPATSMESMSQRILQRS